MQSRNTHHDPAQPLPAQWAFDVKKVLISAYQQSCQKDGHTFEINGLSFPTEVILAISYCHPEHLEAIPLTCILSMDLRPKESVVQKLNFMIDASSLLFDSYFADDNWDGHIADWQEATHQNETFYYQVTRENVSLSIEADRILASAEDS
ncbi:MAG: hypothetical protein HN353_09195 [Bdellovibrionales bacterium]|jgi:hypothetical protein|nr:hypothetical protein [Bdellovibrionales bacterium]MBT3527307.1 hypothetical protein [Bdellovibrionales bacterium]MBT7669328.1 hypothetical protein [Bdellovibrionales bacterium]MBT7767036.1 hypothetical protein [Bdellovibrionales bacterium]